MTTGIDPLGKFYKVLRCTTEDIFIHLQYIATEVEPDELEIFPERMLACIEANTAYKINNSCFMYYKNFNKHKAEGVALYAKNQPRQFLALCFGIMTKLDTTTQILQFKLHKNTSVNQYKSIITRDSLKNSFIENSYITINAGKLKTHLLKLCNGKY